MRYKIKPTDAKRILRGSISPERWRAARAMFGVVDRPIHTFLRYLDTNHGSYPWTAGVTTPIGHAGVELRHPHDIRTLNEIFVRHDYGQEAARVVVDVGGNIGVSAVYFLTRRADAVVHVWEPFAQNVEVLRRNVAPFGDRCVVHAAALAPTEGTATFLTEPVGRYSGLAEYYEHSIATTAITVDCDAIDDQLRLVIEQEGSLDLLKIDTEGSEQALIDALHEDRLRSIGHVVYELDGHVVHRTGAQLLAARTSRP